MEKFNVNLTPLLTETDVIMNTGTPKSTKATQSKQVTPAGTSQGGGKQQKKKKDKENSEKKQRVCKLGLNL